MSSIKKLYYYTSTETKQKIAQNGNIWATNLAYMNDDFVGLSTKYTISFCEKKDLLS